ncbi:MAG: ATP-binding cassette domain-containing protein, partial [Planctomycetota bacterium]
MLEIKDLHAKANGTPILNGVNLTLKAGEVHAIMGPNGSGKSTLAHVLAGRETFEVTGGSVLYDGKDLLAMPPEDRARAGLFLGFQYPVEIPGVSNTYFLRTALNSIRKHRGEPEVGAVGFLKMIREKARLVEVDEAFLKRNINEGFSG